MFGPSIWRLGGISDPLNEMQRLQREVNRLFAGANTYQRREYPPVNVFLSENDVVVMAEVPGLEPDKTDISITRDILTITGSREPDNLKEGESYHRQERPNGQFARTLQLPFLVDSGKVSAKYENGILAIQLPRAAEDKPHRITVKAE